MRPGRARGAARRSGGGAHRTPGVVVRKREGGLALEIAGSWASQWRHSTPSTGMVWDVLAMPALALPQLRCASPLPPAVLILGFGGGSVARLLRALSPGAHIVGVEREAGVLRAARQHFDLGRLGVEVRHADARHFLARCRRRFDLVVDDLFVGTGDEVHKPDWLFDTGLARAVRCLRPGGVLVSNSLGEASAVRHLLRQLLPERLELSLWEFENRVFAASAKRLDARALRRAIQAEPLLRKAAAAALRVRRVR